MLQHKTTCRSTVHHGATWYTVSQRGGWRDYADVQLGEHSQLSASSCGEIRTTTARSCGTDILARPIAHGPTPVISLHRRRQLFRSRCWPLSNNCSTPLGAIVVASAPPRHRDPPALHRPRDECALRRQAMRRATTFACHGLVLLPVATCCPSPSRKLNAPPEAAGLRRLRHRRPPRGPTPRSASGPRRPPAHRGRRGPSRRCAACTIRFAPLRSDRIAQHSTAQHLAGLCALPFVHSFGRAASRWLGVLQS